MTVYCHFIGDLCGNEQYLYIYNAIELMRSSLLIVCLWLVCDEFLPLQSTLFNDWR